MTIRYAIGLKIFAFFILPLALYKRYDTRDTRKYHLPYIIII